MKHIRTREELERFYREGEDGVDDFCRYPIYQAKHVRRDDGGWSIVRRPTRHCSRGASSREHVPLCWQHEEYRQELAATNGIVYGDDEEFLIGYRDLYDLHDMGATT